MALKEDRRKETPVKLNKTLTRREAIKVGGIAAAGLVFHKPIIKTIVPSPAFASYGPSSSQPPGAGVAVVTVYRLRTRNTRSCNACKIHHRYVIGDSKVAIDQGRAHPGCNCPIVEQRIAQVFYDAIFISSGVASNGVVDLRDL